MFNMTMRLRALLQAQHAAHDRLKKAGQVEPWVFFRMVADGRRGPKKPQPILAFNKVEGGLRGRGLPWPDPARPTAHRGTQHCPRGNSRKRVDENERSQDPVGVRTLQHHFTGRPAGSSEEAL